MSEPKMNPHTEVYLRLYILDYLKVADKEFRNMYLKIMQQENSHRESKDIPFEIDGEEIAC